MGIQIILTIIGLIIALIPVIHIKKAQIGLRYYGPSFIRPNRIKQFLIFVFYKPDNPECGSTISWIDAGTPRIVNTNRKSIKDFTLYITYRYPRKGIHLDLQDINPDYELFDKKKNERFYYTKFKYKNDVLTAQTELLHPIRNVLLPVSKPFSIFGYRFCTEYSIKYDGIKGNRDFLVENYVFVADNMDDKNKIDDFYETALNDYLH